MLYSILQESMLGIFILAIALGVVVINRRRPAYLVVTLSYFISLCFAGMFVWTLIKSNLFITSTFWIAPLVILFLLILVVLYYWNVSKKDEMERQQSITMVSHNFLTPLSRIKYAIGTLLHEIAIIPEDKQKNIEELAEHVLHDTDRLIHGTTVLLEFSDLANRRDPTHFGQTDVSQVLDELQESFRLPMVTKSLNFKIELPEGPLPKVFISKFYLKTVLEVILDNAQSYTPQGGSIFFKITRDKKYLIFSITDTGIGLSKESQKHVFEKFFVPTTSTAIKDSGMGLGLSVSKDIIERNHGKIWVTSEGQGKGTTFSFRLPYAREVQQS